MSDNASPARPSGQAAASAERQAIDRVVEALRARCPGVPAEVIARKVGHAHDRFSDAPVREFVPVLVERQVRAELTVGA